MSQKYLQNFPFESTKPRKLTKKDKYYIESTFYQCDLGNKGYLSQADLKVASVALLGYKPSKVEVDRLLENSTVQSKDGQMVLASLVVGYINSRHIRPLVPGLGLDKFTRIMMCKMAASNEDEDIRQMFLTLDSECRGFLTIADVKKAFAVVAPRIPSHSIESAFREIDRDGDGRMTYRDFEFMMKYNTEIL